MGPRQRDWGEYFRAYFGLLFPKEEEREKNFTNSQLQEEYWEHLNQTVPEAK